MGDRVTRGELEMGMRTTFIREGERIRFKFKTGEILKFFPGETDLAGREVNEQLKGGTFETEIYNLDTEEEEIFSFPKACGSEIAKALEANGFDFEYPYGVNVNGEDASKPVVKPWINLTFTVVRKSKFAFKATVEATAGMEVLIKDALWDLKGEAIETVDDLALRVMLQDKDLNDEAEVKKILLDLKGKYWGFTTAGLKLMDDGKK